MPIPETLAQSALQLKPNEVWYVAFGVLTVVGTVLAAIGGVIAFFLRRYWDTRDRKVADAARDLAAKEAERSKQRDVLYESLKWFEGRTQRRSIGISVVRTSWGAFEEFRPLWIEVFVNQAIYLLTGSKQGTKPHEHDNLRRIMDVLVRERVRIAEDSRILLRDTIDQKLRGKITGGLTLTGELKGRLKGWRADLAASP
jgi:hypothetical protein